MDTAAPNNPPDLPRAALANAQTLARRGAGPRGAGRRRAGSAAGARGAEDRPGRRGGFSGAHPDENDPQPIANVLAEYVEDRGWDRPLTAARVFADWTGLVGTDMAAHCRPTTLVAGELRVEAESTAWATQLRLLASTVLARLVAELGPEVVTKVYFTGPVGPSWKHGGLSVPGARGPRDTYG